MNKFALSLVVAAALLASIPAARATTNEDFPEACPVCQGQLEAKVEPKNPALEKLEKREAIARKMETLADEGIREGTRRLAGLNHELARLRKKGETGTANFQELVSMRKDTLEALAMSRHDRQYARNLKKELAAERRKNFPNAMPQSSTLVQVDKGPGDTASAPAPASGESCTEHPGLAAGSGG